MKTIRLFGLALDIFCNRQDRLFGRGCGSSKECLNPSPYGVSSTQRLPPQRKRSPNPTPHVHPQLNYDLHFDFEYSDLNTMWTNNEVRAYTQVLDVYIERPYRSHASEQSSRPRDHFLP